MSFRLLLPAQILQTMLDQARAELPNECCGFLAGRLEDDGNVGRVTRAFPLVNAAASPIEFWADEKSLLAAHKEMDRLGLDMLAIYHSHPTSPPVPSKKDRERSYYGDTVMNLIISMMGVEPEVRAWWVTEQEHREATWEVVEPSDHDQRFKTLIQEFFEDFLRLFFENWAERVDFSRIVWLDKEVFSDPPDGPRRTLDLVAKLPLRQEAMLTPTGPKHWLTLVHVEIESPDKAAPLRPRMFRAYAFLRDKHQLPVLPIGLFLKVGLKGIGVDVYEERFFDLCPLHFEYLYVGLPALDGVQYVQGDNWLGVALAALMGMPREKAAWLGAEALRKICGAPLPDQKRFLLGECVQAYLPLSEEQQQEFERIAAGEPYQGVRAMNVTWYEKGVMEGEAKGKRAGKLEFLRELLEEKFGQLPPAAIEQLEHLDSAALTRLKKTLFKAQSLRDLGLEQ